MELIALFVKQISTLSSNHRWDVREQEAGEEGGRGVLFGSTGLEIDADST